MVLPLFPDDYFCYFTGITKMSTRKFVTIIVLGKPWCILAYCLMTSAAVV
ncbi:MAG: TVP38/TMEM64 family protein, partial [Lachnospiraceae bacterium]|nr:TVP38/TMEM64 family protein [Lachnospiraceae bacterium]